MYFTGYWWGTSDTKLVPKVMYPYTLLMELTYSKSISPKVGTSRVSSRNFKGDVLGRSIQLYRMWFLFLRLGLDCEDNNIPIIDYVNNKKIKIKVNRKFYKEWDLDRVKTDTFDSWWSDKKSMFIESKPTVIDEIVKDENSIYLRIDKRSKIEDVVKELRTIIKPTPSFTSKYGIQKQHKYIPTHIKYNVFVWKQEGYTRTEILEMLNKSYKYYDTRIPKDVSSVRRCLRNSEDLILSSSKGVF